MADSATFVGHNVGSDDQAVAWQADRLVCRGLKADACYGGPALCLSDIHADPRDQVDAERP
jgi:hypothetical protein